MEKVLSIDWLALWCLSSAGTNWESKKLKQLDYSTRVFHRVCKYHRDGMDIAVITYRPCSSALDSRGCIVKFENWVLYSEDRDKYIGEVLRNLCLSVQSISRLDLALDFNAFEDDLQPREFIGDFLSCKYLHNGRGKFCVQGSQQWQCVFEYLRLGTRKSAECVYLYNKTKELQEVKDKPYIREMWKACGLDTDKEIWRLEVSMNSDAVTMYSEETGEIFKLGLGDVLNSDTMLEVYKEKIARLFQFKINDNTKNKTRMKTLRLFDFGACQFGRYRGACHKDNTRRERMLLKSLHKFGERYGFDSMRQGFELGYVKDRLIRWAGMEDYYLEHKDLWDLQE